MGVSSFVLVDVAEGTYVDQLELTAKDAPGLRPNASIKKQRLYGGLRDNVDVIEIDNGSISVMIIPTRGMGLWKVWSGGNEIGWNSPVNGPVHPQFVPLWEPSGIGWLEGFDELFVRCGMESNGAPEFNENGTLKYPLHGKLANLPAHYVEVTVCEETGEICVTGIVDESRLFGNKMQLKTSISLLPGEKAVTVYDDYINLAAGPSQLAMLYHINIGEPFLSEGAQLIAPIAEMCPRTDAAKEKIATWDTYTAAELNCPEQVYFTRLQDDSEGNTEVLLLNALKKGGFGLQFNTHQLPYFVVWKNPIPSQDGYVTGLEPTLNFPNVTSFEDAKKRIIHLEQGESYQTKIRLEYMDQPAELTSAQERIESLKKDKTPVIHEDLLDDWVC